MCFFLHLTAGLMKIPDKWYTKLWKSFQRNKSSAAQCSTNIKIIQDDYKSTFYTPCPDFKLFFFLPLNHNLVILLFQSLPLFTVRVLPGLSNGDEVLFFFSWLCSLNSLSLIKQRGKLNRVEQTRFTDKQNLPPTAGDGNYSGSGNQAVSLWLWKVHSKSHF